MPLRLAVSALGLIAACSFLAVSAAERGLPRFQEIPFEFEEGFIWIKARSVEEEQPIALNFLLDTGASTSAVDLGLARRLGLPLGKSVRVEAVGRSVRGHWPARLAARAGEVPLPGSYLAVDLSALSQACGRPIDGLVGLEFLRDRITQIDFKARKVRLMQETRRRPGDHVIALREEPWGLSIPASVDGQAVRMVRVDTGCAAALHWVRTNGDSGTAGFRKALAFSELSLASSSVDLEIGSLRIGSIPVLFHRKPILGCECGLLGNGVWSKFALVTLDLQADRLVLSP